MSVSAPSVFFHPRTFWHGKVSGISRYFCELALQLQLLGVEIHIPIRETRNVYLQTAPFFQTTAAEARNAPLYIRALRQLFSCTPLSEKARRMELRAQAMKALRSGCYDIIHPTHTNATEILPFIHNSALVITVHDMTHELFPHSFAPHDPSSQRKRLFANRASHIIAISRKTKEDLIELFNIPEEKVSVVHHGNSLTIPTDTINLPSPIETPYFLFVGKRSGYKNFRRLVQAFAAVAHCTPEIQLICAGGGEFTVDEIELIRGLGIQNRVHQEWVTNDRLALLYHHSLAFVYPSEYEGFGLPILEAFACQTPVLCSNASCFPEIAGNAAAYFCPQDVDDIAQLMVKSVNSSDWRRNIIQRGKERLAEFSWAKTARETLEVYNKAMQCRII